MKLLDKLSDKLVNLIPTNTTSKRKTEWYMMQYYVLSSTALLLLAIISALAALFSSLWYVIPFVVFALLIWLNLKLWDKVSDTLLIMMYGNGSNTDENGDTDNLEKMVNALNLLTDKIGRMENKA